MIRYLLLSLVLVCGCAKRVERFASYRNGQSVTVKADNRQGVVIGSYPASDPSRQGETEYLVRFEIAEPKRGQKYATEGFRYDQLSESE